MCAVTHEKIFLTVAIYCVLPINNPVRATQQNYIFHCKWLVKMEIIYTWFYSIQSGIIVIAWASSADFGRLSKAHFKYQNPFFATIVLIFFLKATKFSINSIYNHYYTTLINGKERDISHSFLMFSWQSFREDLLNAR